MATGQQFHKSSLLGTLAYMGSPAAALRSEATAGGLDASSLYARPVAPLSADTTTAAAPTTEAQWNQTFDNTGQTGSGTSNIDTSNLTATTDNTGVHTLVTTTDTTNTQTVNTDQHNTVTTTTDTTTPTAPQPPPVVTHEATTPVVNLHTAIVQGDPHWTIDGTTWTETGIPENTYLLASGNDVAVTGLYVMNGYDYCTIGAVQVVVQADPSTGTPEMHIQMNLTDTSHVIVNGQTVSLSGFNHQYGGSVSIAQEQGGPGLVVTTHTADNKVGQYTIDASWSRGFSVTVNGSFDNAGGIINYLGATSNGQANVNQDTSTINSYVESNFNLSAQGFTDGVINKDAWPPGTSVGW